jgi:hypothetical protein
MLEHLILVPHGGLCNRLRAIASARRVCAAAGARCSVVWEWGAPDALFEPVPDVAWLPRLPADTAGHLRLRHLLLHEGGSPTNRRVPTRGPAGVVLSSHHVFSAEEEASPIEEKDLRDWFPRPSASVQQRVEAFARSAFIGPVVAMHIRRTDNRTALTRSPDQLFDAEAQRIIAGGARIFLATDNRMTERRMLQRFGDRIIVYPKSPRLSRRWPRAFDARETVDDLIDLLLLAACQYVVGCAGSSYSRQAVIRNGSSQCKILELPRPAPPP